MNRADQVDKTAQHCLPSLTAFPVPRSRSCFVSYRVQPHLTIIRGQCTKLAHRCSISASLRNRHRSVAVNIRVNANATQTAVFSPTNASSNWRHKHLQNTIIKQLHTSHYSISYNNKSSCWIVSSLHSIEAKPKS